MKHIAKALAKTGRGPDTELLHVSRNELKHLAGLAGLKELPKNPVTGLHEAGLFESILPIVGGVAGGVFGGPMGAAAGAGLGTKLAGGSNEEALRNAAIGGIGAAGIGALSASAAPATQASMLAEQTAGMGVADAGIAGVPAASMGGAEAANAAASQASGIGSLGAPAQATPAVDMFGPSAPAAPVAPTAAMPTAAQTAVAPTPAPTFADKALGFAEKNPMLTGSLALGAYGALNKPEYKQPEMHQQEMKGQSHSNRTYTGGTQAEGSSPYGEKTYFANNNPYSYTQDHSTYEMRYASGGQVATGDLFNAPLMPEHQRQSGGIRGYAEGGAAQPAGYQHTQFQSAYQPGPNTQVAPGTTSPSMQAAFSQPAGIAALPQAPQAASAGANPIDYSDPNWYAQVASQVQAKYVKPVPPVVDRFAAYGIVPSAIASTGFAKGGVLNLRGHSKTMDPMFLRGAGDGMSDSIPAQIDGGGKKPSEHIRVADGEFIVPADVTAHLGNGSSDAGARQLHAMMDRIRKDKTGKKAQPKAVNPKKYLPK